MTDQELLELVMDEGRAYVAMIRAAEKRDATQVVEMGSYAEASDLLANFHEIRTKLRGAVLDRLEQEQAGNPFAHGPEHPARVVRFEKETR